ncbi:hypothetical protein KEF85_12700 [Methylomonas paludis]|uniref:Secreted protein n=1 Tax=Methylomonas paludis TaxID=1173101 RepID=A0A975MLV7_9GAMM|nr:hypothetical protein [Methylomonas paludis]QWF70197.1 hypothetical protein KEF85_12700 [Methylomonas paludis]
MKAMQVLLKQAIGVAFLFAIASMASATVSLDQTGNRHEISVSAAINSPLQLASVLHAPDLTTFKQLSPEVLRQAEQLSSQLAPNLPVAAWVGLTGLLGFLRFKKAKTID